MLGVACPSQRGAGLPAGGQGRGPAAVCPSHCVRASRLAVVSHRAGGDGGAGVGLKALPVQPCAGSACPGQSAHPLATVGALLRAEVTGSLLTWKLPSLGVDSSTLV